MFPSERDIGTAFETVKHAAAIADASREFKGAVATMRITVKDFSANTELTLWCGIRARRYALALAKPRHHRVARWTAAIADNIVACAKTSLELSDNFTELVKEQRNSRLRRKRGLARTICAKPATRSNASSTKI